ncbi:DUF4139 domain-containing protein [Aurantivibrio plasticivorans]
MKKGWRTVSETSKYTKSKGAAYSVAAALLTASISVSSGEIVSSTDDQKDIAVTIYNDNLAMVREQRDIKLPKGEVELALREVSALIIPETAILRSKTEPGSLNVLEQNFDFDLLTPQSLLTKYIGRDIQVILQDPTNQNNKVETATVLATNNGTVLKIGDRIETNYPGRMVFPDVPGNLRDKPTLIVTLNNERAKTHTTELNYLTSGLGWRADYVAELNEDDSQLDLSGWVTLTNSSGTSYNNALLQLVAGDVGRVPSMDAPMRLEALSTVSAKPRSAMREEEFFDYHLYTLNRRTTLRNNQTKQVSLLNAESVPVKKEYYLNANTQNWFYRQYQGDSHQLKVDVYVQFENEKENGLGMPLPKGTVRAYKNDSQGRPQFVGEDRIDHTPDKEAVRLKLGNAFDVTAERYQTEYQRLANNIYQSEYEIILKNAKEEPVEVIVNEFMPGDWRMISESAPHVKESSTLAQWTIQVPPKNQTVLNYRVEVRN